MTTGQQVGHDGTAREELAGAVGRLLRETRESYQQDIATVAQQLRIRSVYLRAIEEGNYQALPGSTYAVGFVRTYAEYLGLDPLELVRRFRDEAALVNRKTKLVFPVPTAEAKVPSGAILLVGLFVAVLAYGGWYYLSDRDRNLVDIIPAVPESLKEMANSTIGAEPEIDSAGDISASSATAAEAPALPVVETLLETPESAAESATTAQTALAVIADDAAQTATAQTTTDETASDDAAALTEATAAAATEEPTTEAPAADAPATEEPAAEAPAAAAPATEEPAAAAPAAAAPATAAIETAELEPLAADPGPEPAAEPAATQVAAIPEAPRVPESVSAGVGYNASLSGSRIVIVARMESWVEVQNAKGEAIWGRVLRAGDRYLVPDEPGMTMTVGNAGGIDVFVDGDKAPSLGTVGIGRRGVMLDPDRLASGTALP
ncbi:MAG: RodZ domain-containing protein [Dongiaceae bacterium]